MSARQSPAGPRARGDPRGTKLGSLAVGRPDARQRCFRRESGVAELPRGATVARMIGAVDGGHPGPGLFQQKPTGRVDRGRRLAGRRRAMAGSWSQGTSPTRSPSGGPSRAHQNWGRKKTSALQTPSEAGSGIPSSARSDPSILNIPRGISPGAHHGSRRLRLRKNTPKTPQLGGKTPTQKKPRAGGKKRQHTSPTPLTRAGAMEHSRAIDGKD